MEASKLTISPERLRFDPMTKGKRAKLRHQNILDLINSKPAGTPISLLDFTRVTGSKDATVHAMLKTMIKWGVIIRVPSEGNNRSYCYTVVGKAVTKAQAQPAPVDTRGDDEPKRAQATKTITEYAKEFVWESNSDSLRDFVKWMDGKELDLRRLSDKG